MTLLLYIFLFSQDGTAGDRIDSIIDSNTKVDDQIRISTGKDGGDKSGGRTGVVRPPAVPSVTEALEKLAVGTGIS